MPGSGEGHPCLPGSPSSTRLCLPFRGAGRCGRAGGWHRGTPRAQLFPACPLSQSLPATAPGAQEGDAPLSLGQPLGKGTWKKHPPARHRFEEFWRFISHRGWGETKQDKNFTVTVTYLQPTSSPKVAKWQRGMCTATNASTRLYTRPELCSHCSMHRGAGLALSLLPTTLAAQIGFKARANHLPALTPLPHVPRPACRGLGMKTTLLQRSPRLTPLLLLQLHLNTPPSLNGTETWTSAPNGEGETGGDVTRV